MSNSIGKVQISQIVLEKSGGRLLSNYWFQQRGRWIVDEYLNKWFLFWDSITKKRTDGALVRIEMPLHKNHDVEAAQAALDEFTQLLEEVLPEGAEYKDVVKVCDAHDCGLQIAADVVSQELVCFADSRSLLE